MNGRITFMKQDENGFLQVWVANADLSSQTQVTSGAANSGWPVWAPGGSRIAFDSDRADSDTSDSSVINDVFTIKPDGSNVVKLTDSTGLSGTQAYSPDGSLLAFESDRGNYPAEQGIYVALATDGSSLQRVTTLPKTALFDTAPRFSPDGIKLIFTRYRSIKGAELGALFVVNVDGSGLRQLTPFTLGVGGAGDADWSPDGTRLTFETSGAFVTGGSSDVYIVNVDGSRFKNLTHNRTVINEQTYRVQNSNDPVWSPDGSKILFLDGIFLTTKFKVDLATINPDGSARAFIVPQKFRPYPEDGTAQEEEHQPDWESIP